MVPDATQDLAPAIAAKPDVLAKIREAIRPPATPTAVPLFMTVDQVTEFHPALSRGFVVRMIRAGVLPAFRTGHGYVIHRDDLVELRPSRGAKPSIPSLTERVGHAAGHKEGKRRRAR